jgi:hypothetical protein
MLFFGTVAAWARNRGRNIFRYYDGTRWVRADPVVIGNRIEEFLPKYVDLLDLLRKDAAAAPVGPVRTDLVRQQREAMKAIAKGARDVFDLPELGKIRGGVTDPEAIAILTRYHLYMERLAHEAELFMRSESVTAPSPVS